MCSRLFEGISFRDPDSYLYDIALLPEDTVGTVNTSRRVSLENLWREISGRDFGDTDDMAEPTTEQYGWDFKNTKRTFSRILRQINMSNDTNLSLAGRWISLVPREEMKPKSPAAIAYLREKYGEYMVDGGAGDCRRISEGKYRLRVAHAGLEDVISEEVVLGTLAHEYGHTLGTIFDDPVLEEVKAYSFQELVLCHYNGVDRMIDLGESLFPGIIHDKARYWMYQLLDMDMPHGAIIAHIGNCNFGRFNPLSYRRWLGNID